MSVPLCVCVCEREMRVYDSVRDFREDKAPLFFFPFFEEDLRLAHKRL